MSSRNAPHRDFYIVYEKTWKFVLFHLGGNQKGRSLKPSKTRVVCRVD
jgi:hypothetical protein